MIKILQLSFFDMCKDLEDDGRRIVKIGVNFDSATRTIGEWKIVD